MKCNQEEIVFKLTLNGELKNNKFIVDFLNKDKTLILNELSLECCKDFIVFVDWLAATYNHATHLLCDENYLPTPSIYLIPSEVLKDTNVSKYFFSCLDKELVAPHAVNFGKLLNRQNSLQRSLINIENATTTYHVDVLRGSMTKQKHIKKLNALDSGPKSFLKNIFSVISKTAHNEKTKAKATLKRRISREDKNISCLKSYIENNLILKRNLDAEVLKIKAAIVSYKAMTLLMQERANVLISNLPQGELKSTTNGN